MVRHDGWMDGWIALFPGHQTPMFRLLTPGYLCVCMDVSVLWSDPNDPRKVIVKNFKIIVQDRPEGDIDLDLNDPDLKKKPYIMKEGSHYKICLDFYVQHEIVTALKFMNYTKRKGIQGLLLFSLLSAAFSVESKSIAAWTFLSF